MANHPRFAESVDATRPFVVGYLRSELCGSQRELAQARQVLAAFAHREGYALGPVLTEHLDTAPAAFSALIEAVKHYDARAIAIPGPEHLAVLGAKRPLTTYVQNVTGVPVFTAQQPQYAATTVTTAAPAPAAVPSVVAVPRFPP